ncbi:MAG: (Fe-S)-binding protein [Dehalococcoidales bacterium]|nr:(Fe-S)-binding protein [Dehalococcoidales bacterium]
MSNLAKDLVPPGLTYIADNITAKGNIVGASKAQGAAWAKDLNLPKRGETVFFAGCGYQYTGELKTLMGVMRKADKSMVGTDALLSAASFQKKIGLDLTGVFRKVSSKERGAQPLRDAVKVLDKLGVKFGYLAEDEPCCGGLLHYAGLQNKFAGNARQTYQKLKSLGVKRIIGIVPSCTNTLRNLFPRYLDGYDIEVRHFSEVVLENMASRKLKFPGQAKVTYHDPCQLARFLKLANEPRQILKAIEGVELVEPSWTKGEWATCCGGGGGFEAVFPELSQILAVNRANELLETGARIIVTHCPGCIMQLEDGLKEIKSEVEVLDLAQVLAMSMGD